MTQIMNHGKWLPYVPEEWPEWAPRGAMFCRRESDGVDWYDYSRDKNSFAADSVKFAVLKQEAGWIVGPAIRDATRMYPVNQMVLEIIDYHGADPQAELGNKLFDLDAHVFRDLPPLPDPMQPILDRLAVIEAKLGITP